MTPRQRRKIKAAIELLEESLNAEQEPQLVTRPEVEPIQTREGATEERFALGFFDRALSGKAAKHFRR